MTLMIDLSKKTPCLQQSPEIAGKSVESNKNQIMCRNNAVKAHYSL